MRRIIILSGIILILLAGWTYALDAPHNETNEISCFDCHLGGQSAVDPNTVCAQCHVATAPPYDKTQAPSVQTHSSDTTSNQYGTWNKQCTDCHYFHFFSQHYMWGAATYLVQGQITSITDNGDGTTTFGYSNLTVNDSNWSDPGTWGQKSGNERGLIMLPNINDVSFGFEVVSADASSITVKGSIAPFSSRVKVGYTFALIYGQAINSYIDWTKTVKFFSNKGQYGFAHADNPPTDSTPTGICQVCHTLTKDWLSDGSKAEELSVHSGRSGTDCTVCHPHEQGFAAAGACDSCHGYPPVEDVLNSNSTGGNSGLTDNPAPTGSATAGAHQRHATSTGLNYSCDTCHTGYVMPESPEVIDIGFNIFTYGGTNTKYNGQSSVTGGYRGNNGTTVTNTGSAGAGNLTCSNIYCHSIVQSNGGGALTPDTTDYASPVWDDPNSVQCGSCHKGDGVQGNATLMDSGSHTKHVDTGTYNFACSKCHNGAGSGSSIHVNNVINVVFDPSIGGSYGGDSANTGNHAPGQGYGSCSSVYCHSDGFPTPTYKTVTWGGTLPTDCTGCHGNDANSSSPMATNVHGAHMNNEAVIGTNWDCSECHYNTVTDSRTIKDYTYHVNQNRDVVFNPVRNPNGTYDGNYSCQFLYCHSNGKIGTSVGTYQDPPDWNSVGTDLQCNGCHGTTNAQGYPDYVSGGAGTDTANSHPKHVANAGINCSECHNETTQTGSSIVLGSTTHINMQADVVFDPTGDNSTATYDINAKTCSTTYCHGTGTPQWGGTVNCGDCHAVNNILAGRHSTHWAVAINASTTDRTTAANNSTTTEYIFTCAVCHNGVQHAGGSVSADQAAEIVFDTTVAGGGTYTAGTAQGQDPNGYNWTAGTCSSTYCHSDGNGGGPNNTSFNWASPVGTLDCKGCHKYTAASGDPIASGKHSAHVGTAASPKYAFSCSKCHNATTDGVSITDKTKHVNHTKDVVFDTLNPSGAYDSGTKACASLYCHSDGAGGAPNVAVDWATATLPTDCTGCHNNDVTSGSPMATGNHTEHINNASVIGTNRTCDDCHNATVSGNRTIVDYTLHVNGTKNVVFAISGTYDAGTKQCSTVYCHSNGQVGTSVEQYITMTWGDATDIGCNGCHGTGNSQGYPDYVSGGAGTDTANSHPKHVANAGINCSECHNETTQDNVSIVAGSTTHLNQVEDVVFDPAGNNSTATYDINTKTCSTTYCHGTGTPQWGGTVNCGECHPANNTLAGSHSKHYESATTASDRSAANNSTTAEYIFNCGVCHYSTPHADGPVNANRAAQVAFDGVIGSGTYTEGATSQTDPASGFKYTNATCSNVYCHGNFPGNGNNATPEWGNASSAACGTCHDVDTSTTMDGGSHNTHVKNLGFGCDLCHSTTTDATPSIIDKTKHANGAVTWDLGDGIYLQVSASSTYRGLNAGERDKSLMGPPYGQCDNIYCHSNVQTSPPGGALTYQQPQWGGTVNCGDCHKAGPYGPGLEQDTGSHLKHVSLSTYNISCSNCHSGAGSGTQNHANYEVNVNIDPTWGAGASYSGTLQPGDAYGSCSNVYCHSIGDTAVTAGQLPAAYGGSIYATPTWGNTLSCNSCHGRTTTNGMPDYTSGGQGTETANSHPKHVQTQAYSCKECHYSTTKDGTTIDYSTGTHVNGTNTDVVFDATGPNSGGSYNATTKECSNVYCHSDGKGTYQTPIWGGTVACGDCHAVPPPTGSHTVHFGGTATEAAYGDDSNISTATTYKFNCGNCHPLNMTSHGDGVVEVELYNASATGFKANNPSTASYDSNNKQCSNVYCHSDGRDATVRTYQTTPQWGSTFAGNKCAGCHGDPPMYANGGAGTASANSHYTANEFMGTEGGHLVGLHWDNIYDAQNGGLLARGGTVGSGAAHGDPNTSTTISCNLCHAATVNWTSSTQYSTLSGAGTAFACANCHDGTQAFANASGVITDKSKHVNASRDVQFASITFKSRAQLRDQSFTDQIQPLGWTRNNGYKTGATSYDSVNLTGSYNSSTKTCTTACHLNQPVQWGDNTGVTCNSCHTGL